jgi:ferredoxin, 2Fe-2S
MPKATFVADNGSRTTLEIPLGHSLMEAAVHANLSGILGECGGSINCATCHVYVESGAEALPPVGMVEEEMLDATASERLPQSRLSCQIFMSEQLGDIVVRLPPTQV